MAGIAKSGGNRPSINIAISDDQIMGSDYTFTCYQNGSEVAMSTGYTLETGGKRGQRFSRNGLGHAGVSAVEGYYSAATSRIYCRFAHEAKLIANAGNDFVKDLSPGTKYYLLAAACQSLAQDGGGVGYHGPMSHAIQRERVDLSAVTSARGGHKGPPLIYRLHGALMLLACALLAPAAALLARYYRLTLPFPRRFLGLRLWLQLHRGLQFLALLLVIAAFSLIVIQVGGLSPVRLSFGGVHRLSGLVIIGLMILNFLLGVFHPKDTSSWRPAFNWSHLALGSLAQLMAVPSMLIGLTLSEGALPRWCFWALAALVLVHVAVELCFQLENLRVRRSARRALNTSASTNANESREPCLSDADRLNASPSGTRPPKPLSLAESALRRNLGLAYLVVALAIVLGILVGFVFG